MKLFVKYSQVLTNNKILFKTTMYLNTGKVLS